MFDLVYYLNGRAEDISLDSGEFLVYPSSRLVSDLQCYLHQRGLVLTPEAIRTINEKEKASLNDGGYIMMSNKEPYNQHVLFGKEAQEMIDIQYRAGILDRASFYCFPSYGGLIYGRYADEDDEKSKVQIFYFNDESINFFKQINPDVTSPEMIVSELLLNKNGILPDGSFEYNISKTAGFTTILNIAIDDFKQSNKLSR